MKRFWTLGDLEKLRCDKLQLAEMTNTISARFANGEPVDLSAVEALKTSIRKRRVEFQNAIEQA